MDLCQNLAAWTAGNRPTLAGYGASVAIFLSLVTANSLRVRSKEAFAATSDQPRQGFKNGAQRTALAADRWNLEL